MRTTLCDKLGIQHPIVGFTPSEHVAAAISRAGGLGVLGCVRFNDADELDAVLDWMDRNTDGRPYGVDIVMPAKIPTEGTSVDLDNMIPPEHRAFVRRTLEELGAPELPDEQRRNAGVLGWLHSVARSHVDVALRHPVRFERALDLFGEHLLPAGVDGHHQNGGHPDAVKPHGVVRKIGQAVIEEHRLQHHGGTPEDLHVDPDHCPDQRQKEPLDGRVVLAVGNGVQNAAEQADQTADLSGP